MIPLAAIRADVLQPDAEVDGAARRHDSFSGTQLRTTQVRQYGRAEENQPLPEIFLVETVLGGDGLSLTAAH